MLILQIEVILFFINVLHMFSNNRKTLFCVNYSLGDTFYDTKYTFCDCYNYNLHRKKTVR